MPKYYFNFENGEAFQDMEGTVLSNCQDAQESAATLGGEMLKDDPAGIWRDGKWMIEVADEWGVTVLRLSLTVERLAGAKSSV